MKFSATGSYKYGYLFCIIVLILTNDLEIKIYFNFGHGDELRARELSKFCLC